MSQETSLHVVFVISSLGRGGSERQMINLAAELNRRGHQAEIALLSSEGPMVDEARRAGVPVLPPPRSGHRLVGLLSLVRHLRRTDADIVHPYLPRDNALVTLVKPILRRTVLVWGVRSADMDWSKYRFRTRFLWRLVVFMSRFADLIIANSRFGAEFHIAQGYPKSQVVVIPNGIDTSVFAPLPVDKSLLRNELGVPPDGPLIGMLGRFDPMKGHDRVLHVFARILAFSPKARLLVVGAHSDEQHASFLRKARILGIDDHVSLLFETGDPERLLNALDLLILPSVSEAFPNVVAEALSCGVPVAAYDVGDVHQIVDGFGAVVPRGDEKLLANVVSKLLQETYEPFDLHDRVHRLYSIQTLTDRTLSALSEKLR